jgi:gas vesicle protein
MIMSSGKVLLGVLAGVAAGALIGVLFAPEKGSVTRRRISKKGDDYLDELKEKFDDFFDTVTKDAEIIKDRSNEIITNGTAHVGKPKVN